ncbi:MAG: tetratricopeptide repeat protein [Chloroflexota bacterium]
MLDNFEHLLSAKSDGGNGAIRLVNKILDDAPNVKLLVTSRERLSLRAEWVYPVEGLPCPADSTTATAETLEGYAAIQLFVRRARQVAPDFPDREEVYPQIARICRLVGGIPLGIELASGWVDQLTCQAIAEGIEADLDFLVTSLRDMPDRHQSLRAVFEHSWKLLPVEERAVLSKTSVFRTAFSRAAAREVAQAAPHQLASLVNKSFLHLDVGGRYSLHLLLEQFLARELAADPAGELDTRRRHAVYFARFLKEREHALTVQYKAAALDEAGRVIGDVRAAWDGAVARNEVEILSGALEGIFIYYWARNQFVEGQAVFESALKSVEALEPSHQNRLMSGRLQSCIADFLFWLGDLDAADRQVKGSISILQALGADQELAYALELSSRISYWQGNYPEAEETAGAAIELARRSESLPTLAQALSTLASVICDRSGEYEAANALYAESLALYRQLENPFGIAKVLINQGTIYYEQGDLPWAQRLYRESLDHYRELNYAYGISACLNNLAIAARRLGDCEGAKGMLEESLALKRETGNRVAVLHSLLEIGALETDLGNFAQARSHFCEALQIAVQAQAGGLIFDILLGFADLYGKTGEALKSAELVTWSLAQENASQETRSQAESLKAELESKLGPDDLARCGQRARKKNVDHLIEELLGE